MSDTLEKLQRRLDRQMGRLAQHLHTPPVSPNCMRRVKAAVRKENARLARRERARRAARPALVAAAAVLLTILLRLPVATPTLDVARQDPAQLLSEWVAAIEESSEQATAWFSDPWLSNGVAPSENEEQELEDLLDALDQSQARLLGT